jgi:Sec-independent protein translocase protein TatA
MFDISFSELMAVMVVALNGIVPERLQIVARTMGASVGLVQRFQNGMNARHRTQYGGRSQPASIIHSRFTSIMHCRMMKKLSQQVVLN